MPTIGIAGTAMLFAANPFAAVAFGGTAYFAYRKLKKSDDAEMAETRADDKKRFGRQFYSRQSHVSYGAYLASPAWSAKRQQVLARSAGCCESPGCKSPVEEVHHLRYPRVWGQEPIEWLLGLCAAHHRSAHDQER